jgi:hypothetical protein
MNQNVTSGYVSFESKDLLPSTPPLDDDELLFCPKEMSLM